MAEDDPPMSKLTFNQRNMVLYRSGEKAILHYLISMSNFCLALLTMSFEDYDEAKKSIRDIPEDMRTCRHYLTNRLLPQLVKMNEKEYQRNC